MDNLGKVLIVTHAAGTPEIGPNMRTYYLGRNLAERGYKVHIVGSGHFHKYVKSPLINNDDTNEVVDGINYHWLRTFNYKSRNYKQIINQFDFVFRLWQSRSWIREIEADVVILSSPPPFSILSLDRIFNLKKVRLIFEVRDLWPEILKDLGTSSMMWPYLRIISSMVRKSYKKAAAIVSVKPGDLDYIKSNYKAPGLMAYIPNGFDVKNIQDNPYTNQMLSKENFNVVYVGALSSYYAIESLLLAAKELVHDITDLRILIVGDGVDRNRYQELCSNEGITNVKFLGYVERKYIQSILKQCSVGYIGLSDTLANKHGISTNKMYEYMNAKLPMLASYSTDYDILKDSQSGITVPPESVKEIADGIRKLYNMELEERVAMGEKGYEYLLSHHTFGSITDRYEELFKQLS